MEEKLKLICPVVVEGKYDKAALSLVVETPILTLDGFAVFNDKEKKALLKRLCGEHGLIILTDSDRAGNFIRSRLKGFLGEGQIYNVYSPEIKGREKRKEHPSADGLLGVEGIDRKTLRELLLPFASEKGILRAHIEKARFYEDGFSGRDNSSERRKKLCAKLSLPQTLTANSLLEAINLLLSDEEYEEAVKEIE